MKRRPSCTDAWFVCCDVLLVVQASHQRTRIQLDLKINSFSGAAITWSRPHLRLERHGIKPTSSGARTSSQSISHSHASIALHRASHHLAHRRDFPASCGGYWLYEINSCSTHKLFNRKLTFYVLNAKFKTQCCSRVKSGVQTNVLNPVLNCSGARTPQSLTRDAYVHVWFNPDVELTAAPGRFNAGSTHRVQLEFNSTPIFANN